MEPLLVLFCLAGEPVAAEQPTTPAGNPHKDLICHINSRLPGSPTPLPPRQKVSHIDDTSPRLWAHQCSHILCPPFLFSL